MGDFEIVDENTFNRDDGNCRYYNSNTERQCQKANLCFCEFKDPKTDCVISRSKEVCSEEYQVNRLDRGSIRSSSMYGLSTRYRLTTRNSAGLFHHVLICMGDGRPTFGPSFLHIICLPWMLAL